MAAKIFKNAMTVGLAVFLLSVALFMGMLYQYFGDQLTRELATEAAMVAQGVETTGRDPAAGGTRTFPHLTLRRYLAAGRGALRYEGSPNVLVFSPFRDGQVAQFDGAEFLVRDFLKRVRPGFHLAKPALCLKVQERTTQVEERALIDLGTLSGGGKVLLFQEPLSALEDGNGSFPGLSRAVVFDILPG